MRAVTLNARRSTASLTETASVQFSLNESSPFTTQGPIALRVIRGRAWITVEGLPDDWFVEAGERFERNDRRRVIVGADPDCTIAIEVELRSTGRLNRLLG